MQSILVEYVILYSELCKPGYNSEYYSFIAKHLKSLFFRFIFHFIRFIFFVQCLPHSWYLAVDMQLYIFAPFIVYSIHRYKLKAMFVWAIMILNCIVFTVDIHQKYELKDMYVILENEM